MLTNMQQKVADLVAQGVPNKLIAYNLGITEPAVKSYLGQAMKKNGVSNRVQLALIYARKAWEAEAGRS